jgi:hypothetical protein
MRLSGLKQLVKEERKNILLLGEELDIDELLQSVQDVDTEYYENCSLADISREIVFAIRHYGRDLIPEEVIPRLCEKLIDYRYIEKIYQLKFGRTIRWIPLNKLERPREDEEPSIKGFLKYGGVLVKVVFNDLGTNLLLRTHFGFVQLKMNEVLVFQELSDDEKIVMGCRNLLTSESI